MPDPVDDIKAGVPDAQVKKKYNLSDEDLFTLHKYDYATTDGGVTPEKALQMYPSVGKYITTKAADKPAPPTDKPMPKGSMLPDISFGKPATDNTVAVQPKVSVDKREADIKAQPERIAQRNKEIQDLQDNQKAITVGAELIKGQRQAEIGMPLPADKPSIAQTNVKNDTQIQDQLAAEQKAINDKNQKAADDFYNTPGGKAYYGFVQSVWKPLVETGSNMIASGIRLGGSTISRLNDKAAPIKDKADKIADAVTNYFDFDKRANEDRPDASLYATPTKLQGSLINDGHVNMAQLIPKTISGLTSLATLIYGGEAIAPGKAGMLTMNYLNSVEDFRKEGEANGLKGGQLDAFSNTAAGVSTALLAGIPSDNPLIGKFKQKLASQAVKDIAEGSTVNQAIKSTVATFIKGNAEWSGIGMAQAAANHGVKAAYGIDEHLNYDKIKNEVAETLLTSIVPATLMMGPKILAHYKPSAQQISSLNYAGEHPQEFHAAIDKAVDAGTYTPEQGQYVKDNVGKFSTRADGLKKMGYSDDQAAKTAFNIFKDERVTQNNKTVADNPLLKETVGKEIDKSREELKNETTNIALGIPEVGTEVTPDEMKNIVNRTPDTGPSLLKKVEGNTFKVDEIDLEKKYKEEPAFQKAVEEYEKSKEDPEGLRMPAIIDQEGKVLDGKKRLVQQYVNGEKTARVFKQLKPIENEAEKTDAKAQTEDGLLKTEQAPVANPGQISYPLSGISPEAQSKIIADRNSKTVLTERQQKINKLSFDTDKYFNLPKGKMGKQKSEGLRLLNDIKVRAGELGLTYDPTRNTLKNEKGTKVQKRFLTASNQAIIENHTPLHERSAEVQQAFKALHDATPDKANAALFFPNDITGFDGKVLSDSQFNSTIDDIRNGIPSKQAEIYLNEFEKMIKEGSVNLINDGERVDIPFDEYMQHMTEAKNKVDADMAKGKIDIPEDVQIEFLKEREKEMSHPDFQDWYNNSNLEHGSDTNTQTNSFQQAGNEGDIRQNGSHSAEPVAETPVPEDGKGSVLQEGQDFEKPLTNREQAKVIADKVRAWAEAIEVKGDAAYSRPDSIIRNGILSPALKLLAKAIEAGGSIADGIKSAVDYVKSKMPELDEAKIHEGIVNGLVEAGITDASKVKALKKQIYELKRQIKERIKKGDTIDQAKEKITDFIKQAEGRGVFSSTTKAVMVSRIAKILNNAKTPASLIRAMDLVEKIITRVDYDKNINEANALKTNVAKVIKGKSLERAASNVETVKAFLKINPKDVTDIQEYKDIANKILTTSKAASAKIEEGRGVVKNDTHEIDNAAIKDYTDKQLTHAEELAKQRIADSYNDLVDMGVIDPKNMSLKEMKDIVAAVNEGGESVDEKLDRLKAEQDEKKRALSEMVQYQQVGLQDHYDTNKDTFTPEQQGLIDNLLKVNTDDLSVKQLVKLNDVINNIVTNNEFFGSGELAAISEVQRDSKIIEQKEKASGIKLSTIKNSAIKAFASIHLLHEFIFKSSKLAAEVQRLTGVSDIFNGNARTAIKQTKTLNEYDALKSKMGKDIDNPENRFTRGVYARIIQDVGGSPEDISNEFTRVKGLVKQTYAELLKSELENEQQEGALVKKVYDNILADANSVDDVAAKVSNQNKKLVDFWINKFAENVDQVESSSEIYNNKIFERVNNYTATKAKPFNGGVLKKDAGDIFEQTFLSKKLDATPARTKINRMTGQSLGKNVVYDFDFDSVQSKRYQETNYDVETTKAIAKAKAFFASPQSAELLGGVRNRNLMANALREAVLAQKGKELPVKDWEKTVVKVANNLQAKGARIAIGSLSQLPKQYISVAAATVVNLGADMGLYFKALRVSNKIHLFEQSSIGTRGDTKAGYSKSTDIASIDRTKFGNSAANLAENISDIGKNVSEKIMTPLVASDVSVAKTSWLAYYMQDLQKQGINIDKIDWTKAHEDFNKEAGAYAEQMVSRSQNPNNNSELATFYRSKGAAEILKNIFLPFSSFAINQRVRMTNDMQKLRYGGDKGEALKSLGATFVEQGIFNAIKVYALGALTTAGARAIAKVFGFWDDDDEKNSHKYEDIVVHRPWGDFNSSDKFKKFKANTISDFLFSGMGGATQKYLQKGMGSLYGMMNTETYPNGGKENKHPDLFFNYESNPGDPDFAELGMYGIGAQSAYNLAKTGQEALTGTTTNITKGGNSNVKESETVKITPEEHALFVASFMVNAFGLVGASDAEVTNMNRKLQNIMDKKIKQRYGGERDIKIFSKGKGEPE